MRIAERAGFCYGVRLAIDKAKHAREEGREVTTLGQLVHNPGIKADLSDRGIRTADLADQVEGGTLVIRAHGVPASEMEKLRAKAKIEPLIRPEAGARKAVPPADAPKAAPPPAPAADQPQTKGASK